MAYSYEEIMQAQAERLQAEHTQASAELESARLYSDPDGVNAAADRILQIDNSMDALRVRAQRYYSAQQSQPQGNKYGLSPDEIEIARGVASGDRRMSNDERERLYAENKSRYQRMRATGEYRDDQGTVRR